MYGKCTEIVWKSYGNCAEFYANLRKLYGNLRKLYGNLQKLYRNPKINLIKMTAKVSMEDYPTSPITQI